MALNMAEQLFCGDCLRSFEFQQSKKRGSALVEFLLWSTLLIPGPIYGMWRRRKSKKECDYCGSDFILSDTPKNRQFVAPTKKKQS